jgi:hypothetical protein
LLATPCECPAPEDPEPEAEHAADDRDDDRLAAHHPPHLTCDMPTTQQTQLLASAQTDKSSVLMMPIRR